MPGNDKNLVNYIEVSLSVPRNIHDAICNFIIENYSRGLVLEEEEKSDKVGIKFHVPESGGYGFRKELTEYINRIKQNQLFDSSDISTRIIRNIEWVEAYRQSVKVTVVDNVFIRPPWLSGDYPDKLEIIIEPKMAFGTGTHETTRLCIREILKYFKPGQTFFDLGCGSGILSILAAKLGANVVKGVDIELMAIQNAEENIKINNVGNNMQVELGSIEKAAGDPPYDFLVANLIKSTILQLYDKINDAVKPGGIIVLSGLLIDDEKETIAMLREFGVLKYNINKNGQWVAIRVDKK
jgi:ribosomal protein L11 methyltransferase